MIIFIPLHDVSTSVIFSMMLLIHFFFFNDTAPTEIYTLSLHDALPISSRSSRARWRMAVVPRRDGPPKLPRFPRSADRSEEHTSELQSRSDLVCRLLLEKKKTRPMRF